MIDPPESSDPQLTTDRVAELQELQLLCKKGMLYEVERWIRTGRPIQLTPGTKIRGAHRTALGIALETGQHSLCVLLLKGGYRLDLERYSPLNIALRKRRWDLLELLLEHGADPHGVKLGTLFDTYRLEMFERFHAAGVDLTDSHEMAQALAYNTGNKPLYGFVKKHRQQHRAMQKELDIALGDHVREGNEKGIQLCLWAGADPHARARDLEPGGDDDPEDEGWSAVEWAVFRGNVSALRRFKPDPARIDFDQLYQHSPTQETVEFLAETQLPRDMTSIVRSLCVSTRSTWDHSRGWSDALLAVLRCGTRWERAEAQALAEIRRDLLCAKDWELKDVLWELLRPEVCSPEIVHELTRTPTMQKRMLEMRLIKPIVSPREKRRRRVAELLCRFDRQKLVTVR